MTTAISDDFNRANNTSVPGGPVVGSAPTVSGTGNYGILSNQLYAPSAGDVRILYPGAPVDVAMSAKFTAIGSDGCMIFRAVDNANFYMVRCTNGSQLMVYRCVAGGFTALIDWGTGMISANDVIEARCKGEQVIFARNGLSIGGMTMDRFLTATSVGFRNASGDTTTKFDDMVARDFADAQATSYTGGTIDLDFDMTPGGATTTWVYKGRDSAAADTGSAA